MQVGDDTLAARRAVVIATGTEAIVPPIPGLREARPWTNREAVTAKEVPPSLVVLGGGTVGVEMADAFALLRLAGDGHRGRRRACSPARSPSPATRCAPPSPTPASRSAPTPVRRPSRARTARSRSSSTTARACPATRSSWRWAGGSCRADLGVEDLGVEPGRPIEVDDTLRVPGHEWLYVIGDANGRALLTHMGKYQGRIAADCILGREVPLRSDGALSPRVTFTDPQVAAVGHTLASAQEAGIDARAVDVPTGGNAGGSFVGLGAPGTARIVVDEDRRVIVGATFTGAEIAEALHAATIAVIGEVTLDDLWHAVPCFPTRSELWLKLLEEYGM